MSSGLKLQFGYSANEAAYGTNTTVTKFLPVSKASAKKEASRYQGAGIQTGVLGPLGSLYAEATSAGSASFECDVQSIAMGGLFELLMGSSASAQQGGSAAYLQTFTLADNLGKYRTFQVGRPARGGTVIPATVYGGKITQAEFSCGVGENLKSTWSVDAKAWNNTTTLAAASFGSGRQVFPFSVCTVKMGTYGAESSVSGVRGMSMSFERPMDLEDYTAGSAGLKSEPVMNDFMNISGTVSADWLAKTTFEDLAAGVTGTSIVWEFVSTHNIASTYYETIRFTIPGATFEVASQEVDGPAELTSDWPWSWKYDGTNMPKIELITTDTSVG